MEIKVNGVLAHSTLCRPGTKSAPRASHECTIGKKTKKPGKGKEKKEKKTAKAEEKKARRESKKLSPEDDIDAILVLIFAEYTKGGSKEEGSPCRGECPSTISQIQLHSKINPLKETELILYGGEFYNGTKTFVYGDLYRYDVEKQEWKSISSPNSLPPRSAHQAVA